MGPWVRTISIGMLAAIVLACTRPPIVPTPVPSPTRERPTPPNFQAPPNPRADATPPLPTPIGVPGYGWGRFLSEACEYYHPENRDQAGCIVTRPRGTWVWVQGPDGRSWHIYDVASHGPAYVDCTVLEVTFSEPRCGAPPPPAEQRWTVACIDRSSGYTPVRSAIAALDELIWRTLRPGYHYYFRWIDENPVRPDAEVMAPVVVPTLPPRTSAASPTPDATAIIGRACTGPFETEGCVATRTAVGTEVAGARITATSAAVALSM